MIGMVPLAASRMTMPRARPVADRRNAAEEQKPVLLAEMNDPFLDPLQQQNIAELEDDPVHLFDQRRPLAPDGQNIQSVTFAKTHLAQRPAHQVAAGREGRFHHHHLLIRFARRGVVPFGNQFQPLGFHDLEYARGVPFEKQCVATTELAIAARTGDFLAAAQDGPDLEVEVPFQAALRDGHSGQR
jgi:hypothetical protein